MSTLEKVFVRLSFVILVIAGIMLVGALIQLDKTRYTVNETSAYTRVSNCIVSKVADPPTTQEEVERCYKQVEKDSGTSLKRFDFK